MRGGLSAARRRRVAWRVVRWTVDGGSEVGERVRRVVRERETRDARHRAHARPRVRGSASHTSHESRHGATVGDVSCLFSCVLFQIQCTMAIWLGSGLCLAVSRLESDSCVVGLALSTHSLSVLVPCVRGRRAGPRALPPSASLRPAPAPPRAPAARRPPAPESRPQPRARERHVSSS